VPQLQHIQGVSALPYYLDQLPTRAMTVDAPLTAIELPDLSNGPHYAYALQWLAFAVLVLIGRAMLFREAHRLPLEKLEI
jgi:cytochrome oxidase assembly protein ShyY1